MTTVVSTVNKQTFYISLFIVFIAGFLVGVGYTVYRTDHGTVANNQNVSKQNVSNQEGQAILNLESEVTAHPENYNAWIQLGHLYFDSNQFKKAIGAYNKSLELHAGNADLWTDLGVMYRRTDQPEKAITSFDKASSIDNTHEQSLMNKGIVLHFDFGKTDEAISVWESVLQLNPNAQLANGNTLNDFVAQIKNDKKNSNN